MTRRWVRFETPVMVCVEVDEATEHTEVTKVVLAIEHDDIRLARDHTGSVLVYDEHMERVSEDVASGGDHAAARAVTAAEDRTAWPAADEHDWEEGPDPLRFPYLYDDSDTDHHDVDEDDEYEPLDLTGAGPG